MDFSLEFTPDLLAIFLTLFVLEIVLGVDNVIFISILASKLPESQQARARTLGLTLAMVMRVGLVLLAGWIITLNDDLFTVFGMGFSGRELILILGGGFLLYKAVHEIHLKLEGEEEGHGSGAAKATFGAVLAQILAMDLVFSLDSVITAVGMTSNMVVIISAVVISFGILLFAARYIFEFVNRHPTVKMLALSFLLLIGVFLIAEGFGFHIDKAFIYGPMVFAVLVEGLNLWAAARKRKRKALEHEGASEPVRLHMRTYATGASGEPGTSGPAVEPGRARDAGAPEDA
ncbi:TerC family protein [Agrococcus baldri]|uniref:Integral membrane protein TerC n=1 Tax=Agrococcus baldri TaxID=153730 RepID=A0AA87R9I2_9MICO|nr:TerC family protein [Agrococcus baldri]GEK78995.1 integral membrane protein TerC [Agrococcus baldri]